MKITEDLEKVIRELRRFPLPQSIEESDKVHEAALKASNTVKPLFELIELSKTIWASVHLISKYLPKTTQSGYRGWHHDSNPALNYNSIHREREKLLKKLQKLRAEIIKLENEMPEPIIQEQDQKNNKSTDQDIAA